MVKTQLTDLETLPEALQQAVKDFQSFVESGKYAEKSEAKKSCTAAKEELKGILYASDEKRHVFDEHGMVAKFVTKEIRKTDHRGLIEEILNYIRSEALSQVITFNKRQIEEQGLDHVITPYQYEPTYFVKPTLNKNGKSFNYTLQEDFSGAKIDDLLQAVKFYSDKENYLTTVYKLCMKPFSEMELSKIMTPVGSISKIQNEPIYDIYKMIEELGEDFIFEFGVVKTSKLEEWINIGALPSNIVKEHQTVMDLGLDFVVMTLEAEQRAFNAFNYKRSHRFSA